MSINTRDLNNIEVNAEELTTTFEIGMVYAGLPEGEHNGEIVEAGFKKIKVKSKKNGQEVEMPALSVKVKFHDKKGNSTYLYYKKVVSRAESSGFILLMKEFSIPFDTGVLDVSTMVGERVIAQIKHNTDNDEFTYSNIVGMKRSS